MACWSKVAGEIQVKSGRTMDYNGVKISNNQVQLLFLCYGITYRIASNFRGQNFCEFDNNRKKNLSRNFLGSSFKGT